MVIQWMTAFYDLKNFTLSSLYSIKIMRAILMRRRKCLKVQVTGESLTVPTIVTTYLIFVIMPTIPCDLVLRSIDSDSVALKLPSYTHEL